MLTGFLIGLGVGVALILSLLELRRRRRHTRRLIWQGSEQAIAEATDMLRLVLDFIPQRVFWKDLHYRYLGCNIPFAVDAGCTSPEEIIGKRDDVLSWRASAPRYQADDREVMETGKSKINYEEPQVRPDGSVLWLRTSKIPLRNEKGDIIGIMGTYEDITARKSAEASLRASEERYRTLAEAIPDFIFIVNRDYGVDYINPALERALGLPAHELVQRTLPELLPGGAQSGYLRPIDAILASGATTVHEIRLPFPHAVLWLNVQLVPFKASDGTVTGVMGVGRDITSAKLAQEQLHRTLRRLETSNRELEQFAYVASHDLQEPLRMVSSYTQLLARRYRDHLDDDARDFIDFAVEGATRMQRLISDLLSFSRISTKGLPFQSVELHQVLEDVRTNLQILLLEKQAELEVSHLPVLSGDRSQLTRLFQNLVENALKFAGDARPHITIDAEDTECDWIIRVRDNGIGFDPAYKERIFVIFKRLHSRKDYPGTGIGLAICKRIVERHGGQIHADSRPGSGSTFTIVFPKDYQPDSSHSSPFLEEFSE